MRGLPFLVLLSKCHSTVFLQRATPLKIDSFISFSLKTTTKIFPQSIYALIKSQRRGPLRSSS